MIMKKQILSLVALAIILSACSAAPKPPTVNDSKRVPVNTTPIIF